MIQWLNKIVEVKRWKQIVDFIIIVILYILYILLLFK